jgi:hypothetical protein
VDETFQICFDQCSSDLLLNAPDVLLSQALLLYSVLSGLALEANVKHELSMDHRSAV